MVQVWWSPVLAWLIAVEGGQGGREGRTFQDPQISLVTSNPTTSPPFSPSTSLSLVGLLQQGLNVFTGATSPSYNSPNPSYGNPSPSTSPPLSLPSLTSSLVGLLQQGLGLAQTFPHAGVLGTLGSVRRSQERLDTAYTFPCVNTRGSHYYPKPLEARGVGPSDISVVAGLGDYIMVAPAALANTSVDVFQNYPEVSFAMGGEGDWRTFTTVPNLLKQFNPRLRGASSGTFTLSGLNVAGRDALSGDLADQAIQLVSRMEQDPQVNMNSDWKLVTLAAGHSDLCRLSCRPGHRAEQFLRNVEAALDILVTLPNVLISVVSPMDPSLVAGALHRPLTCQLFARQLCPCVASAEAPPRAEFLASLASYRRGLAALVRKPLYREASNALVVLQPGLEDLELPRDEELALQVAGLPSLALLPDMSFLAPDCFHPSQKLHARMTLAVWNNMFEPERAKSSWGAASQGIRCPASHSTDTPYYFGGGPSITTTPTPATAPPPDSPSDPPLESLDPPLEPVDPPEELPTSNFVSVLLQPPRSPVRRPAIRFY